MSDNDKGVQVYAPQPSALTLPDAAQFKRDLGAIRQFQAIAHQEMIRGHDYGVIPGTDKPTLLKPGAEKISKILGLADSYEIIERQEDWDKPFFRYLMRCRLTHATTGIEISQGLGECNSYEGKYRYRWLTEAKLPMDVDATKLVKQMRKGKNGGQFAVYRLDNDDIFAQVNTLVKMAKKRALVDAALSAGRLSDVFTQDIEEFAPQNEEQEQGEPEQPKPQVPIGVCPKCNTELRTGISKKNNERWWRCPKCDEFVNDPIMGPRADADGEVVDAEPPSDLERELAAKIEEQRAAPSEADRGLQLVRSKWKGSDREWLGFLQETIGLVTKGTLKWTGLPEEQKKQVGKALLERLAQETA